VSPGLKAISPRRLACRPGDQSPGVDLEPFEGVSATVGMCPAGAVLHGPWSRQSP
jgi:hypothetical protein